MRLKVFIGLFLIVLTNAAVCSAKIFWSRDSSEKMTANDTIVRNAIGDSIYNIITKAKRIEAVALGAPSDSLKSEVKKRITSRDFKVVNFIVANPKNYQSNFTVYGQFMPQFKITYTLKKEQIWLKYDFGLMKWGVFNYQDKQIAMFDLASDNMLRFAAIQFPEIGFYQELLMPATEQE